MDTEPVRLERRSGQRFQRHLPLTIQVDGKTLSGFTQDVSSRGLSFYTEASIAEGALVEITFTMPSEITLGESMRVRARARVLRASDSLNGQKNAIAVRLDSYQYLPSLECEPAPDMARVPALNSAGPSPGFVSR